MSDNSAWIKSYKRRNMEYKRPYIPPDNILLDFHTKWFNGKFDDAATILANHYSVKSPRVTREQLPKDVPSSYDIEKQIITISDKSVNTMEMMATFLESFFRHMASQNNWVYDKELDEFSNYERSEGGRLASRIFQRFSELERNKS